MKQTFKQYYSDNFLDNYEIFKNETNGVLYVEEPDGQITMSFVEQNQLNEFENYLVITTWVCNFNLHIVLKKKEI